MWFGEGFIDSYTPYILCQKSMWSFESLFIQNMCWLTIVNNMKIDPSIAQISKAKFIDKCSILWCFFWKGRRRFEVEASRVREHLKKWLPLQNIKLKLVTFWTKSCPYKFSPLKVPPYQITLLWGYTLTNHLSPHIAL